MVQPGGLRLLFNYYFQEFITSYALGLSLFGKVNVLRYLFG